MRWAVALAVAGALRPPAQLMTEERPPMGVSMQEEGVREAARSACHKTESRIVLSNPVGTKAGLADRTTIFKYYANLAASLCAELVVAGPPCKWLGAHGDAGCAARWTDYVELAPAVRFEDAAPACEAVAKLRREAGLGPLACVAMRDMDMRKLDEVLDAVKAGTPFQWELNGQSFYHQLPAFDAHLKRPAVRERLASLGLVWPPAPWIAELGVSAEAREVCRRAAEEFGAGYRTLHIRRGDAAGDCPTDPEMVVQYARKELQMAALMGEEVHLVFFTDETDPAYLKDVSDGLERLGLHPHHGDAAVQAALQAHPSMASGAAADAPFAFAVARAAMGRCERWGVPDLAMDRNSCPGNPSPPESVEDTLPRAVAAQLLSPDAADEVALGVLPEEVGM